jgi:hypothetical protein
MAESTGTALAQMNQETALAQEALRDESPQGHPDTQADRRHEERDANLKAIALIAAGMGALGIGMFGGLWLLLGLFTRFPAASDAPISPLALNPPTPSAPRIEDATPQNYRKFLQAEEDILHSAGPIPPQERASERPLGNPGPGAEGLQGDQSPSGNKRISLEQAKAALLQRGFATRPQTGAPPFPQNAPVGGRGKPESLPLGMQPTGTYRADMGPGGKQP